MGIKVSELAQELAQGLSEYSQEVADAIKKATDEVAEEAVQELKSHKPGFNWILCEGVGQKEHLRKQEFQTKHGLQQDRLSVDTPS